MKNKIIIFVFLLILICTKKIYALSDNFIFVIDTVGIPRYNTDKQEINEEVYYTYNVFSYGKPQNITKNQRWKNSKYGFWTKNGGAYKNKGTRGEYYILGYSYSGKEIYNYYFPMDVVPNTTPDKWTFYVYPEASSSWKDKSKYKYEEQLEYMKMSKLMFNDISTRDRADNPKYIKEYNITAEKIGLNKARLDACATWKTYGMISTRRYINGVIYSQVYLVKPMAANADIKNEINVEDEYILTQDEDELIIPIKYETSVINMTGYADKKHIKEIKSNLIIDDQIVDEVCGSKITSVGNEYMLVISRDYYPPDNEYCIKIKLDGYMHTEFAVDGLLREKTTKTIKLVVEPRKIIPVKQSVIREINKEKDKNETMVVSPLAQSINDDYDTQGFTEAGKHIIIKLILNISKESISNIQLFLDDIKINKFTEYSSKNLVVSFKVPEDTSPSLYGEYSLRNETNSYFEISKSMVGRRKTIPHTLTIQFGINNQIYQEEFLIDTLDSVMKNINNTVYGTKKPLEKALLEEWIGQDE